jgi:flagellar motility protein MotE (MotC chaperone)
MNLARLLQSPWAAGLIGALGFQALMLVLVQGHLGDAVQAREEAEHAEADPGPPPPAWHFFNPEVDQLIAELKTGREANETRAKELADLASRLTAEREELNLVLKNVQQMQSRFERDLLRIQDEETANLKKLAKTYAAMEPAGAAKILAAMDDAALVKILVFMKENEVAPVLEALAKKGDADAKRAALISERLRVTLYRPTTDKPKS